MVALALYPLLSLADTVHVPADSMIGTLRLVVKLELDVVAVVLKSNVFEELE